MDVPIELGTCNTGSGEKGDRLRSALKEHFPNRKFILHDNVVRFSYGRIVPAGGKK